MDAIEISHMPTTFWWWAYGIFAIIKPVALGAAVASLIWLNHRAKKEPAAKPSRTCQDWGYYGSTLNLASCVSAPIVGRRRWTHHHRRRLSGQIKCLINCASTCRRVGPIPISRIFLGVSHLRFASFMRSMTSCVLCCPGLP